MLRAQDNDFREFIALDGLWACRIDRDDAGERLGWTAGFEPEAWVAVPGSLNEQLAERGWRDHQGAFWLMWQGRVPRRFGARRIHLRFGSADLLAQVWVNGRAAAESALPFLPFEADPGLQAGDAFTLVVRLDGRLPHWHPLPGIEAEDYRREGRPRDEIFPAVRYDFFPFLGLHRGVHLIAAPSAGLRALRVRGDFEPATGLGRVNLQAEPGEPGVWLSARLLDAQGRVCAESPPGALLQRGLQLPAAQPWSPSAPTLYRLQVDVHAPGSAEPFDRFEQSIGLRRIEVLAGELRLNGAPLQLRGFGMHEDFPVLGKGSNAALRVKDFELLRWVGANSFRSAHYAYAEETLDEADRRGLLVISELASVNLDFRRVTPHTLALHQQMLAAQIARDGGHACVIAWSLTNEPGYLAEPAYSERSGAYFDALFHSARALDPTRPLTAANVGRNGLDDPMYAHCDFLSLNRYHGWYDMPAQLERAEAHLRDELQTLWQRFGKPMLLTEFGADAIPGMHASSDQLFTEEFQAAFIETYWRVIGSSPGCIGGHVWNFADFRTAQHHRRVQFNFKGVFTRTRDPKLAAWRLKSLWVG